MAECKEKWRNIRGRYLRQLKEVPPSGSGVKRKKLYYLTDYLQFIDPYTSSRPQTSNLTVNENIEENCKDYSDVDEADIADETEETSMACTPGSSSKSNKHITHKNGKESSSKTHQNSSLDELNAAVAGYFKEKRSQKTEDHDMDFLKSILPDIKSLDPPNKRRLKINIMKLVDDACREASYHQNTSLSNIHHSSSDYQNIFQKTPSNSMPTPLPFQQIPSSNQQL